MNDSVMIMMVMIAQSAVNFLFYFKINSLNSRVEELEQEGKLLKLNAEFYKDLIKEKLCEEM